MDISCIEYIVGCSNVVCIECNKPHVRPALGREGLVPQPAQSLPLEVLSCTVLQCNVFIVLCWVVLYCM